MRRLSRTVLAIVATVVPSAVAVAQNPPTTPPRQRAAQPARVQADSLARARRPDPAQFGMRRGGPAANLLRLREQLELTDDQVKRLETLQAVAPPEPKASEMMRAQADLMDATKGDVDLAKARAAFERMSRLRVDEQVAHLKVQQDARNVLTAAQKTKFDAFSANVRDGRRAMQMRGPRDMRPGPMRGGDMRTMEANALRMQREFYQGQGRRGPGMPPGVMGPQGGARGRMGPPMGPPGMGPQGQGVPQQFYMRRRVPPPGGAQLDSAPIGQVPPTATK